MSKTYQIYNRSMDTVSAKVAGEVLLLTPHSRYDIKLNKVEFTKLQSDNRLVIRSV